MLPVLLGTILLSVLADGASPEDLASYRSARATVGRDAESQVKLALWCEAHGLTSERANHLAMAVTLDPGNVAARGLLGLISDGARWAKPDDLAEKVKKDADLAASLAEYAEKRLAAPKTAEGHWKLALWCQESGLEAEAKAHFVACVRLDPGRAAAWKRLGCKKVGGRWVTDEQVASRKAEVDAQQKADKLYKPLLSSWRSASRAKDPNKRFQAEKGLNSLKDPRAVASVWKVFVLGRTSPADLSRAVQLLGQIDSPASSRALAMIALDDVTSPDLRRAAEETLARRDPRDYLGDVIGLLRDELRYEVRPVGGPGSPGALYVEGEQFNRMRVYDPPAANLPVVDSWVGLWTTDADGFAEVHIPGSPSSTPGVDLGVVDSRTPRVAKALHEDGVHTLIPGPGAQGFKHDGKLHQQELDVHATETTIPIGRMAAEYQRAADESRKQLRRDVAVIESENAKIRARNARVAEILNNVTNQALPAKRQAWRPWWADQLGYAYIDPPPAPRPTFVEDLPPDYNPRSIESVTSLGPVIGHRTTLGFYDCFAAGTPVRTRDGSKPIESLEVGDHVLAQDTTTGGLGYKPILAVFKFRPAETLRVTFGGETLLTTAVHRFWRVGEGWVMARDLKPGDVVRALGGTARVEAVEKDEVRQVFNLEVADSADYFVGKGAILAGDNSRMGVRTRPFDASTPLSTISERTGKTITTK